MKITEIQQELIDEFSYFEDWQQKYEYLIDIGKSVPEMDESLKTDDRLIKGCQSKVWLNPEFKDGNLIFQADSDGILTKGIVGLLIRVFSGQKVEDIVNADTSFIEKIGLHEFLSPNRANGLLAMIKQIKYYAIVFESKSRV